MKRVLIFFGMASILWARSPMDYYPEDRLCAMVRAQEREAEYGNREYAKQLAKEIEYFRERFGLQAYNEAYCGDSDNYEDGFRDGYYYGSRPYPNYRPHYNYPKDPPHRPLYPQTQYPPNYLPR